MAKQQKGGTVKLTAAQAVRMLGFPSALQTVYAARIANLDYDTKMTFTLLDLLEVLNEFESLQRAKEHWETEKLGLLSHSGGVQHVNELFPNRFNG